MAAPWSVVGTSSFIRYDGPTKAYALIGDVTRLVVPLAYPVSKAVERFVVMYQGDRLDQVLMLWQALVCQCEDPDRPGYEPFPETDDELREVYTQPDGSPIGSFPWEGDDAKTSRPANWAQLIERWYMEQGHYDLRAFVTAFGEALEAVTHLPLERSAPLVQRWLAKLASGVGVSESKPVSTSTPNPTGRKSGRRSTTSSPAA